MTTNQLSLKQLAGIAMFAGVILSGTAVFWMGSPVAQPDSPQSNTSGGIQDNVSNVIPDSESVDGTITVASVSPANQTATITLSYRTTHPVENLSLTTSTPSYATVLSQNVSETSNTAVVTYQYNFSSGNYTARVVDDQRTSFLMPDHHVTATTDNKTVTYTWKNLTSSQQTLELSESTELSGYNDLFTAGGFLYISQHEMTVTEIQSNGFDRTHFVVDATGPNEAANTTYVTESLVRTEYTLSHNTPIDTDSNTVVTVIGNTTQETEYIGVAVGRAESADTRVIYMEYTATSRPSTTPSHEVVHTVQNFTASSDAHWFVEGSAEYLSDLIYQKSRFGAADPADPEFIGAPTFGEGALNTPDEWKQNVNYRYGGRVVYLMDLAIRNGTDDNATIVDYFNSINQHDGVVTHDTLVMYLEDYGAESFVPRFNRLVNNSDPSASPNAVIHNMDLYPSVQSDFSQSVDYPETVVYRPMYTMYECHQTGPDDGYTLTGLESDTLLPCNTG